MSCPWFKANSLLYPECSVELYLTYDKYPANIRESALKARVSILLSDKIFCLTQDSKENSSFSHQSA